MRFTHSPYWHSYIRYTHPPKPHSHPGHGTNVTPRVHTATTRRSGSRTQDSGAGGGRSNKERQRLQPLASVARAPLFEVRRVRFTHSPYWHSYIRYINIISFSAWLSIGFCNHLCSCCLEISYLQKTNTTNHNPRRLTPSWHPMQPPIVCEWQLPACRIWSFLTCPHVCTPHTSSHRALDGFVKSQITDNSLKRGQKIQKVRKLLFRFFFT